MKGIDIYSRPALIIWDVQRGMTTRTFNYKEMVSNIRLLIDKAHAKNIPVIYSQLTGLPYDLMNNYLVYWALKRGIDPTQPRLTEESQDWKIVDELTPSSEDIVIKKYTADFFVGTHLENLLRNREIKSLILTGVSTEVGIETTARHASCLGFIPIVVEDGVGSSNKDLHNMALNVMRGMFELQNTSYIIDKLGHA